ncbi:MAG: VOC family protein [Acidobacteriota bacterium]
MSEATSPEVVMPKHGEFCWTEIISSDLEACKSFYTNVFGWELKQSAATGEDFEYLEYNNPGSYPMGGIFKMTQEMCGEGEIPPPHFMNYIHVDNVDEIASKAFEIGGKIVSPPMDIPNVGRFAIIQDPTGATFSVLTLKASGD